MIYFLIALQFLTIIPVRIRKEIKLKDYGKSLLFFPFIGFFLGCIYCLPVFIFNALPSVLISVIILAVSVIITGAIHLDGFADTCDGFYGNRPREEALGIMRDPHIGAIGVIGIVILLLLKFSIFISLPKMLLPKVLILMVVFSRWSQVLACYTSKYARSSGKAKNFVENAGVKELIAGALFGVLLAFLFFNILGIVIFIINFLIAILFINFSKRKIGGMTGDTIGAINEIAEVAVTFCFLCPIYFIKYF